LHIVGRDIERIEKAMQFNGDTCRWTVLGEAAEIHMSTERQRIMLALEGANEGLNVQDVVAVTDKVKEVEPLLQQRIDLFQGWSRRRRAQ
jgi:hypothetical protein